MISSQYPTRRGYSLVEILVTIAVIGVLVSMGVPTLSRTRALARRSQCAAQMAQHLRVIGVYTADNKDAWPFVLEQDRGRSRAVSFEPFETAFISIEPPTRYEVIAGLWHLPVLAAYADRLHHQTLVCPSDDLSRASWRDHPRSAGTIEYRMSIALLVAPEALSTNHARIGETRFWIGQRTSDVAFASQKSAMREMPMHGPGNEGRHSLSAPPYFENVAACDGSVTYRSTASAILGLLTPEESFRYAQSADVLAHSFTFSRTPGGVRGRDW